MRGEPTLPAGGMTADGPRMTPGHGTPRERRGRLASSPAVRTRDRGRAFRTAAASAALLVAAACSSGGGDDPAATAPADTGTSESSPPAGEAREPGLYVLELATGEIEPLAGVDPDA